MRKNLAIWAFMMALLLGACGNAGKEASAPEDIETQESESTEESHAPSDSVGNEDWETEKGQVDEEPATMPVSKPEEPVYISQDFLDYLAQYLMGEVGEEALEAIVSDQVLSEEELKAYAADPVVAQYIESIEDSWKGGLFLKADGDNDGIEDLLAWINDGGSMGNNSRYFLKGQEDGSFEFTCWTVAYTQEIAFVYYDDTIYLMETDFDYGLKEVNGFLVTLYQDGEVLETLSLHKVMNGYEPEIVYLDAGYEDTAAKYAEDGRNGFWEGSYRDWGLGTAEREIDWETARDTLELDSSYIRSIYRSDLDNDGEEEWYWKTIYYPSNLHTYECLQEAIYEEGAGPEDLWNNASLLTTYGLEYDGVPLFFWVDSIDEKQILFLLCYDGIDREMLYGYLIEGDGAEVVLKIDYIGISAIQHNIYTRGINYEYDPWDPGRG